VNLRRFSSLCFPRQVASIRLQTIWSRWAHLRRVVALRRNYLESCSAARNRVESSEVFASSSARLPHQVRDCPPTPAGRRLGQPGARRLEHSIPLHILSHYLIHNLLIIGKYRLLTKSYVKHYIMAKIETLPMLVACNENELASTRHSRKFPTPLRSDETAILRFLYELGFAPSDMTPSWFLCRSLPRVATKSNEMCNIWSYYMLGRRFVAPAEVSGVVLRCSEPYGE
jgi:hypothetical protein